MHNAQHEHDSHSQLYHTSGCTNTVGERTNRFLCSIRVQAINQPRKTRRKLQFDSSYCS